MIPRRLRLEVTFGDSELRVYTGAKLRSWVAFFAQRNAGVRPPDARAKAVRVWSNGRTRAILTLGSGA